MSVLSKFGQSSHPTLLRVNGTFLAVMGLGAFINDLLSYFFGIGMFGKTLFQDAIAIGQTEAHGLALLTGVAVVLHRTSTQGSYWHWHLVVLHILLGGCNLLFFDAFTAANLYNFGIVITSVHLVFIAANTAAALSRRKVAA